MRYILRLHHPIFLLGEAVVFQFHFKLFWHITGPGVTRENDDKGFAAVLAEPTV